MNLFERVIEGVRLGEPLPWAWGALLTAVTPWTRTGMWWRLRQPRVRVGARVISIGNITAGGTGKTPAVIERAQKEIASGARVAVITRGYRSARTPEPLMIGLGDAAADLVRVAGDEPALIRRRVPGVTIVKSADRVAGARAAIAAGCDVLLLDDGFQSVRLERDENVLLIDASAPFGNRRLLPRGMLREPIEGMRRATQVVLTRCDQAADVAGLEAEIRSICGDVPVRPTWHAPAGLWRVCDGAAASLGMLHGAEVTAVSSIARPESFTRTLESLGARVAGHLAGPDHSLPALRGLPRAGLVITTEKTAVAWPDAPENVYALAIALRDWAPAG